MIVKEGRNNAMTFGERIYVERNRKRLSLREASEKTGFSAVFISELEHGRKSPSLKSLYILARFYGFEDKAMFYLAASKIASISFLSEEKRRKLIDVVFEEES